MIHRYWKFGVCLMALLSFVSTYAAPLCCTQSFCSRSSLPVIDPNAKVLKNLPAFNAIDVSGPIDVQIFGGADCQQVALKDPQGTRAEVKDGILFLSEGTRPLARERLLVKVYMSSNLTQLNLSNAAKVAGECIQSHCLTIFDASCRELCLRGHIVLNKLISTESGDINLEWVDSNSVEVIANKGAHIHLAGRANHLYAQLADTVHLDTQYLRVKSAWVKADAAAQADIFSSRSLNAFAEDSATVNYQWAPKSLYINTDDMANSFWWSN